MTRKINLLIISTTFALAIFAITALFVTTGCTSSANTNSDKPKIGISMPTKDLQRWSQDGAYIKQKLENDGYPVMLQYASNDISAQVTQIESMIGSNCKILIIAPIDGNTLCTVLAQAKENNIPVISYDRLLMDSDAVKYYATFDNYNVGQKQGQYIVDKLDLNNANGPFNIEVTGGEPGDNNLRFFYGGAMDVLRPYFESGKLVSRSGQTKLEDCACANWSSEIAQSRMDAILAGFYGNGQTLDACLCLNDTTAFGVTNSLEANYHGKWPIVTGQDCEISNVKNIIKGTQTMSIYKDTRILADRTTDMVNAIVEGREVPTNDTSTYDNGAGVVPTWLCTPVVTDITNYKKILVDSGYYTEEDLTKETETTTTS